jgi:peroxiredoxin
MALLHSNAPDIGAPMPKFKLMSVDEKPYTDSDFGQSKALLIAFICSHCPYVRAVEDRLIALKRAFKVADFELVGICSNDPINYPEDSAPKLKQRWLEKDYGFPYLVDVDQTVAKAFGAVCTPDLFLYDHDRRLFYHGRLDDNWQDATKVKKHDLKEAIVGILEEQKAPADQKPSMGCSIKWR